jgi:hypothetical protein
VREIKLTAYLLNEMSKIYGYVKEHTTVYLKHVPQEQENLNLELIVLLMLEKKHSVIFMKSVKFSVLMEQMQSRLILLKQD